MARTQSFTGPTAVVRPGIANTRAGLGRRDGFGIELTPWSAAESYLASPAR
ncbi:hypothetical protein IPZ58_09450 [Streptomyces roseoverticillatus]|uniref:hypothetical protein n=1 Tax=Streptomyces roseoverticillatus TaxID=66429 RepID=UPI001F443AF0|nr:hypothetical protein [Streptomyces roseoverticillatus]MCF3101807.1 hypothetical protein [Streptomyces roseoverticillatus]